MVYIYIILYEVDEISAFALNKKVDLLIKHGWCFISGFILRKFENEMAKVDGVEMVSNYCS